MVILAEADTRIDGDIRGVNASRQRRFQTRGQFGRDFRSYIIVGSQGDHVLGAVAHMHEHHGAAPGRDQRGGVAVVGEAGNIVNNGGAGIQRGTHGGGVAAVDGNRHTLPRQPAYDRQHTGLFLAGVGAERARPRAFAADIQDVGASLPHGQPGCNGTPGIQMIAAIAETVRRHV